jgi:hypothetical protein
MSHHHKTEIHEDEYFKGFPGKEALELIGVTAIFRRCHFVGGSSNLRLNACTADIEDCTFEAVTGPADPDGQCVQLINSVGRIHGCTFEASPDSEDLLSIYGDKLTAGTVLVEFCTFNGRGKSDSGNAICMDGAFAPSTIIRGGDITDARCGITIAGGVKHEIHGMGIKADTSFYAENGYGAKRWGPVLFERCDLSTPGSIDPAVARLVTVR